MNPRIQILHEEIVSKEQAAPKFFDYSMYQAFKSLFNVPALTPSDFVVVKTVIEKSLRQRGY